MDSDDTANSDLLAANDLQLREQLSRFIGDADTVNAILGITPSSPEDDDDEDSSDVSEDTYVSSITERSSSIEDQPLDIPPSTSSETGVTDAGRCRAEQLLSAIRRRSIPAFPSEEHLRETHLGTSLAPPTTTTAATTATSTATTRTALKGSGGWAKAVPSPEPSSSLSSSCFGNESFGVESVRKRGLSLLAEGNPQLMNLVEAAKSDPQTLKALIPDLLANSEKQTLQTSQGDDVPSSNIIVGTSGWSRASKSSPECYELFRKLLLHKDFILVQAACEGIDDNTTQAQLIEGLVSVFDTNGLFLKLIEFFVRKEVNYCTDPTTLFRSNSYATKFMKVYTKHVGEKYLSDCFQESLDYVLALESVAEVDPLRLPDDCDEGVLEKNLDKLREVCDIFLEGIYKVTPEKLPRGFRKIARVFANEVEKKYPASKHVAIAGVLFLRYLIPAIINPRGSHLMDENPSKEALRTLVLASKVLQNLANGVTTVSKEVYLRPFEPWLKDQRPVLCDLFDDLVAPMEDDGDHYEATSAQKSLEMFHLFELQKLMRLEIDKIGRLMVAGRLSGSGTSSRDFVLEGNVKQGFLKKTGASQTSGGWRNRWFVLKGAFLYYFKSPQHANSAGLIPLENSILYKPSGVSSVKGSSKPGKEMFVFCIETNYRVFHLQATTEKEREEWMDAVKSQIAAIAKLRHEEDALEDAGDRASLMASSPAVLPSDAVSSHESLDDGRAIRHSVSGSTQSAIRRDSDKKPMGGAAKKGYLRKKGGKRKNWKRRWFILKDNMLLYYKGPKESVPQGEICIENSFVREGRKGDKAFMFELDYDGRTYFLEAAGEEDRRSWMQAIKRQKAAFWKTQTTEEGSRKDRSGDGRRGELEHKVDVKRALMNAEREGYLRKQGGSVKNWKRRWVVLHQGRLHYFKNPQDTHALGTVDLTNSVAEQSLRGSNRMEIVTRARCYFFESDSEEDTSAWIEAINATRPPESPKGVPERGGRLKVGWLEKQGRARTAWRRRWIVLEPGLLSYYKTPHDADPAGVIPLESATIQFSTEESIGKHTADGGAARCFEIFTRYRNFFFQAADEVSASAWMEACERAKSSWTAGGDDEEGETSFHHLIMVLSQFEEDVEESPAAGRSKKLSRISQYAANSRIVPDLP